MCLIRCVRFLLPQVESKYRCDLIIQSCLDPMYKKKKKIFYVIIYFSGTKITITYRRYY